MYLLCRPANVILGKMLYQSLVILLLAFATLLFFSVMLGTQALKDINLGLYILTIVTGALGIAFIFTIISAMATKAGNKQGLSSILGIPLLIPLLVSLNELCVISLKNLPTELANEPLLITASVDILSASLAYILFPYIWTE
jgi:heme exporter protein B